MKHTNNKFDIMYKQIVQETNKSININNQQIINEGFLQDVLTGSLAGGITTALITAAQGAVGAIATNALAGLMIRNPWWSFSRKCNLANSFNSR